MKKIASLTKKDVSFLNKQKKALASGISIDAEGNETKTDFRKMLNIVKKAKFSGFVGIEYEGSALSEIEGIKATKKLLEKIREEYS